MLGYAEVVWEVCLSKTAHTLVNVLNAQALETKHHAQHLAFFCGSSDLLSVSLCKHSVIHPPLWQIELYTWHCRSAVHFR